MNLRAASLLLLLACETGGGVDNEPFEPAVDGAFDMAIEIGLDAGDGSSDGSLDGGAAPIDGNLAPPGDGSRDGSRGPADAAADAGADGSRGPTLRVATWNLHCLVDDWAARLPRITATLARFDPDVMFLQEVCQDPQTGAVALDDLVAALRAETGRRYWSHWTRTHRAWDRYDEGVALLSAHELRNPRSIDLPPGLFPRTAVVAEAQTPLGEITVASTHLSFGDQAPARARQLAAVTAALPADALLGGDLNQTPDEGPVAAAAAAGYRDAWGTVNPNDDGFTYPAERPRARIDYLLLGAGWRPLTARRMGVAPVPTDHFGVVADVAAD